ncbi:MAG: hypothetical protein HY716_13320 [Planctomycetes bacterium]|nr:hypothetical protein [Planctomycetota bacterium]
MSDLFQGFGWSIYLMLGILAVLLVMMVLLFVKYGKTKPVGASRGASDASREIPAD